MPSNVMETVFARARAAQKTVVLPEADDVRTVTAAERIVREGLAKVILVSPLWKIEAAAKEAHADISGCQIVDPADSRDRDRFASVLLDLRRHKGMTEEQGGPARARPALLRLPDGPRGPGRRPGFGRNPLHRRHDPSGAPAPRHRPRLRAGLGVLRHDRPGLRVRRGRRVHLRRLRPGHQPQRRAARGDRDPERRDDAQPARLRAPRGDALALDQGQRQRPDRRQGRRGDPDRQGAAPGHRPRRRAPGRRRPRRVDRPEEGTRAARWRARRTCSSSRTSTRGTSATSSPSAWPRPRRTAPSSRACAAR